MGQKKLTNNKHNIDKFINEGVRWLTNSGIQNIDKKDKNYGGYYAWFDQKKKKLFLSIF